METLCNYTALVLWGPKKYRQAVVRYHSCKEFWLEIYWWRTLESQSGCGRRAPAAPLQSHQALSCYNSLLKYDRGRYWLWGGNWNVSYFYQQSRLLNVYKIHMRLETGAPPTPWMVLRGSPLWLYLSFCLEPQQNLCQLLTCSLLYQHMFVFMYACAYVCCVCACSCVYACMYVHMCMEAQGLAISQMLSTSFIFLRQVLSLPRNSYPFI